MNRTKQKKVAVAETPASEPSAEPNMKVAAAPSASSSASAVEGNKKRTSNRLAAVASLPEPSSQSEASSSSAAKTVAKRKAPSKSEEERSEELQQDFLPLSEQSEASKKQKTESKTGTKTEKADIPLLLVRNLPRTFGELDLFKYFSQFGVVKRASLARSKRTGRSLCTGYVQFEHDEVAVVAAAATHNYLMKHKLIKAEYVILSNGHARALLYSPHPVSFEECLEVKNKKNTEVIKQFHASVAETPLEHVVGFAKSGIESMNSKFAKMDIPYVYTPPAYFSAHTAVTRTGLKKEEVMTRKQLKQDARSASKKSADKEEAVEVEEKAVEVEEKAAVQAGRRKRVAKAAVPVEEEEAAAEEVKPKRVAKKQIESAVPAKRTKKAVA